MKSWSSLFPSEVLSANSCEQLTDGAAAVSGQIL